jgi:hypothetical protein
MSHSQINAIGFVALTPAVRHAIFFVLSTITPRQRGRRIPDVAVHQAGIARISRALVRVASPRRGALVAMDLTLFLA